MLHKHFSLSLLWKKISLFQGSWNSQLWNTLKQAGNFEAERKRAKAATCKHQSTFSLESWAHYSSFSTSSHIQCLEIIVQDKNRIFLLLLFFFPPLYTGRNCSERQEEALIVTGSTSYNGSLNPKSTQSILIVASTRGLCTRGSVLPLFITHYSSPPNSPPPPKLPSANIHISICVGRTRSVIQ